jgi:hypothetical protein
MRSDELIDRGAILTRHVRLALHHSAVGGHVGREDDGPHDPAIPGAWRFSQVGLSYSWERAGAYDRRRFFLPDWDGPRPEREWPVRGMERTRSRGRGASGKDRASPLIDRG